MIRGDTALFHTVLDVFSSSLLLLPVRSCSSAEWKGAVTRTLLGSYCCSCSFFTDPAEDLALKEFSVVFKQSVTTLKYSPERGVKGFIIPAVTNSQCSG